MFLITFNIPVPFTTLLEVFRTFHAKKWFLMGEVLSYPFKARNRCHANKDRVQIALSPRSEEPHKKSADLYPV